MLAKMRREQGLSKTPFFLNPQLKSPPLEGFKRSVQSAHRVDANLPKQHATENPRASLDFSEIRSRLPIGNRLLEFATD